MNAPPKTLPLIAGIPNHYGYQILELFQPLRKGTSIILFGVKN